MRNFLGALLCLGMSVTVHAQTALVLAPPTPKYNLLPHLPFPRFQIGPVTKTFYANFSEEQVKLYEPLDSKVHCPQTNSVIKRVYDRIVKANNLDTFFHLNNINMKLVVLCPNGYGDNARAATGILIISAAFVKTFMQTEDELAMILSHELSHVLQASDYKYLTNKLTYNLRMSVQEEDHADENALVMLSNAGYDPHSAYQYEWRYLQTLSVDEAMNIDTHSPPVLRPALAKLFVERHRLQKKSATKFSTEILQAFAEEVDQN